MVRPDYLRCHSFPFAKQNSRGSKLNIKENSDLSEAAEPHLARRLGLFDTTMIVMGGIIGSGIFINPYVVAQQVPSTVLILSAWAVGGLIALAGAFIYAELSSQTSLSGGQYVYLRDAFHPALAFVYGWALLLVIQSGGMAAVAVTFAKYLLAIGGAQTATLGRVIRRARPRVTNRHQLLWRARRQHDAEFFHDFETDRDRRAGRVWTDRQQRAANS